jgi:hypothetical protein
MVGVASKPVEPRPPYFAGFLTYGNRKFVENLKLIGALLWKSLSFQFYTAMYNVHTVQFGILEKKARGCSKAMVIFTKKSVL